LVLLFGNKERPLRSGLFVGIDAQPKSKKATSRRPCCKKPDVEEVGIRGAAFKGNAKIFLALNFLYFPRNCLRVSLIHAKNILIRGERLEARPLL
jgi:hypothetical protein